MKQAASSKSDLARLGAPLVIEAVAALAAGPVPILPQDRAKVTKAPKLRKEDGVIDWSKPAAAIHNLVRAMQPWPVASTIWHAQGPNPKEPMRLIVHTTAVIPGQGPPGVVLEARGDRLVVAAGEGAIALKAVQIAGKKPVTATEFLRGHRVEAGDRMEEGR